MAQTRVEIDGALYETYASLAEANRYMAADPALASVWAALSTDARNRALVGATRLLDRQSWQGTANPLNTGLLTLTGLPVPTETFTVGTDAPRVYTFQSVLTDSDGNVALGTDGAGSATNLVAALNLGAGAGTAYAASTTENTLVTAQDLGAGRVLLLSRVGGAGGVQALATTVSGATLEGSALAPSTLAWPRSGLVDAAGQAVDANTIPPEVTEGFLTLAGLIGQRPALAAGAQTGSNIERVRAGSAEVQFFRPTSGTLFPRALLDLFGIYLTGAAGQVLAGSVAYGADGTSQTPSSLGVGTDFGLTEGLG